VGNTQQNIEDLHDLQLQSDEVTNIVNMVDHNDFINFIVWPTHSFSIYKQHFNKFNTPSFQTIEIT
jgi:hypothetical protein